LSARWWRNKKRLERFNTFRTSNRVKDEHIPQIFRVNPRTMKQRYPFKYRIRSIYREKKWKEPEPLIDVFEEQNEIVVVAEFAGFKKENLRIHVKNQKLMLSAKTLDHKYHKSLNLPKRVIPDKIRTTYKNGVLEIRLRKVVEEKVIGRVVG